MPLTSRQNRDAKRAFILGYAGRMGCLDCGEHDPRVLEFDHREQSSKKGSVSRLVSGRHSLERIMEEIEKCDVRCANCHKLRTAQQMGFYGGFDEWIHQTP